MVYDLFLYMEVYPKFTYNTRDIPHEVLIARNLRKYVSSKETPEYTFWGILYIWVDLQK